ncbi:hypothetical protein HK104_007468 [Borealophlyctis nickersoniae]|nr:hypothetical protein HK104_007468 [Borealophlyctis nickersoniae]
MDIDIVLNPDTPLLPSEWPTTENTLANNLLYEIDEVPEIYQKLARSAGLTAAKLHCARAAQRKVIDELQGHVTAATFPSYIKVNISTRKGTLNVDDIITSTKKSILAAELKFHKAKCNELNHKYSSTATDLLDTLVKLEANRNSPRPNAIGNRHACNPLVKLFRATFDDTLTRFLLKQQQDQERKDAKKEKHQETLARKEAELVALGTSKLPTTDGDNQANVNAILMARLTQLEEALKKSNGNTKGRKTGKKNNTAKKPAPAKEKNAANKK